MRDRHAKSFRILAIILFGLFLSGHGYAQSGKTATANPTPDPNRKTKVDLRYEKSKDLTSVTLRLTLSEGVAPTDSVDADFRFTYPGHIIVTPSTVGLRLFGLNDSGINFHPGAKLVFYADGKMVDPGTLKEVSHQDWSPPSAMVPTTFQVFEVYMGYDTFVEITKSNQLTVELDGRRYKVSPQNLQALRDFAELMRQSGKEFK